MKSFLKAGCFLSIALLAVTILMGSLGLLDDDSPAEQKRIAERSSVVEGGGGKVWTIKTIPNTRLKGDNIHVSDPDGIIGAAYCDSINRILSSVRDSADIFVVAVNQIDNANGDEFTHDLFKYWGIGDKEKNNGVLMLMTMTPHFLRIETGYGMEGVLTDAKCSRIMHNTVTPLFKENKYPEGTLEGVKAMAFALGSTTPEVKKFAQIEAEEKAEEAREAETDKAIVEGVESFFWTIGKIILWIIVILHTAFSLFLMKGQVEDYKKAKKSEAIRSAKSENAKLHAEAKALTEASDSFWFVYLLFPLVFLTYIPIKMIIRKKRRQTRYCPICGKPLRLLSEKEEDKYLKKIEQLEDDKGAVDYDVWYCEECDDVNVEHYQGSNFTYYKKCKKCGAQLLEKVESKVILKPTYDECGEEETVFKCRHCGHEERERTSIPSLKAPESSEKKSRWWQLSDSDNDSDRDSGGSYDSGSFGGGSSGGGGASTSW